MSCDEWTLRNGDGPPQTVLLPGWGTDGRIFDRLDVPGPHLIANCPQPEGLFERLSSLDAPPVRLVGWSLGGFHAVRFANRHPEQVKGIILAGVRQSYPPDEVETMMEELDRSPRDCLRSFYRRCFLPAQKRDYRWFRGELMSEYLKDPPLGRLRRGLEFLRHTELTAADLPDVPVTMVHGTGDLVAPLAEARGLAEGARQARIRVIDGAGHAVFLTDEFGDVLDDG